MRGFSGHFPPFQLLFLWDLVLAYDSMEVLQQAVHREVVKKERLEKVCPRDKFFRCVSISSTPVSWSVRRALAEHWQTKRFSDRYDQELSYGHVGGVLAGLMPRQRRLALSKKEFTGPKLFRPEASKALKVNLLLLIFLRTPLGELKTRPWI